ncbi:MAG: hypothetical protein N2C14_03065, partial [Planctomycetales bacterium]
MKLAPPLPSAVACFLIAALLAGTASRAEEEPSNARRPATEQNLRYWLENMVRHHRFTNEEVARATGLSEAEILAALKKWEIRSGDRPARKQNAPLVTLPYPGGRHPRIG